MKKLLLALFVMCSALSFSAKVIKANNANNNFFIFKPPNYLIFYINFFIILYNILQEISVTYVTNKKHHLAN